MDFFSNFPLGIPVGIRCKMICAINMNIKIGVYNSKRITMMSWDSIHKINRPNIKLISEFNGPKLATSKAHAS